jgi:hypothetical protein
MDHLEEALRQALRREAAPADFAGRALARSASPTPKAFHWADVRTWVRPHALRWAAASAVTMALLLGLQFNAERRRRAQGELAKQQMLTALRITADKVERAHRKVQQVTTLAEATGKTVNSI